MLLVESFKLVPKAFLYKRIQDQKVANRGSTYMAPVLEGESIGADRKTVLKGELLIWRTKNQARDQGTLVQRKDSICFKSVQIGS
jgi:hypothetical protein